MSKECMSVPAEGARVKILGLLMDLTTINSGVPPCLGAAECRHSTSPVPSCMIFVGGIAEKFGAEIGSRIEFY